ncbi:hypothetical protein Pelo_18153 [Pelomyxa schiedti]|nr:hypothetical protein Pelo_18153 [Pelomyxa schiedti]
MDQHCTSGPFKIERVLDARSQFVALACGAMIPRCGRGGVGVAGDGTTRVWPLSPVRLLSNATHVLVSHIGTKWVVPAETWQQQQHRRAIGFSVCGSDPLQCGDCCLVVFVGLSPTLGVVWHRVHVFGGSDFGSASPCSNSVHIGCYLGCGRWLASFDRSSVVVEGQPLFAMAEDSGRMMVATSELRWSVSLFDFESNGKWLVLCKNCQYLLVWRLDGGLPVGHCKSWGFGPSAFSVRVRFNPLGCNSHHGDELVVATIVTSDTTELLFVDLQESCVGGRLAITRSIVIPHTRVVDFQWVSHDEFLLLYWSKTGFVLQPVVNGHVAGGTVLFPEPKYSSLHFVQPAHVLARTKVRSGVLVSRTSRGSEVYSTSNLSEPLCLQTHAAMLYLHLGLVVFASDDARTVRHNFQDVGTGTVLFAITRTNNVVRMRRLARHQMMAWWRFIGGWCQNIVVNNGTHPWSMTGSAATVQRISTAVI